MIGDTIETQTTGPLKEDAAKFDNGKPSWSLLPVDSMRELVRVYGIGAKKYGRENWRKGMEWHRVYDAMTRHAQEWMDGARYDPVDGQHHLASVAWGALTLIHFELNSVGKDTRHSCRSLSRQYVAGIIDGEGWVGVRPTGKRGRTQSYAASVSVGMVNKEIPHALHKLYGGRVSLEKRNGRERDIYRWTTSGKSTEYVLTDVIDFLVVKKRQASLLLELQSIRIMSMKDRIIGLSDEQIAHRERIYAEIRSLNAKGRKDDRP